MSPKVKGDFRERVRRETLRGKLAIFHENIETYLTRQARAYTTWRVFAHWCFAYLFAKKCNKIYNEGMNILAFSFPDPMKYGKFWRHPNYRKLGHLWSWFYFSRNLASMLYY